MMSGMWAAISGLEAHQTMLDVTANNIANVDTIGYKSQRATFVDELAQTISAAQAPSGTNGGTNAQQVGLGVQVGSIDNLMGAGSLQTTGNPTDLAIQGDGFLQVAPANPSKPPTPNSGLGGGTGDDTNLSDFGYGNGTAQPAGTQYTRAGNLKLDTDGYLTTQSGQYVLGTASPQSPSSSSMPSYIYLHVPPGATNLAIGQDGEVTYTDPSSKQTTSAGYLSLASFPNEAGLQRDGGSMWSISPSSGSPTVGTPQQGNLGSTISGTLEMSNVDLAGEFSNMITAERGYQANTQVISTANQMLQSVIQMPAQG